MQANPFHAYWLLVSILVIWRLTTLICYEAGPFNLFSKFRMILYRIRLGTLIDCFHCAAVWVSVLVTISIYRMHIALIFLALAAAGGASFIERIVSFLQTTKQTLQDEDD